MHEGFKPFKCDKCQKQFGLKSQLNGHVKRVHLNERNHFCTFCDKACFSANDLKQHMQNNHDERQRSFRCASCGKSFFSNANLKRHFATCTKKMMKIKNYQSPGQEIIDTNLVELNKNNLTIPKDEDVTNEANANIVQLNDTQKRNVQLAIL